MNLLKNPFDVTKLLASLATGHCALSTVNITWGSTSGFGVPLLPPPHWDLSKTATWKPWDGTSTLGPLGEARNHLPGPPSRLTLWIPLVATGDSAVDNTTLVATLARWPAAPAHSAGA